jgi:hypothetical protein|uniref:hypothetical protein n=1 Tax=Vibrio parahaemolyticus TaxID=670 RepID=UPI0027384B38|nr:hypothetical protein [Vibrio parahaemolyticus]
MLMLLKFWLQQRFDDLAARFESKSIFSTSTDSFSEASNPSYLDQTSAAMGITGVE